MMSNEYKDWKTERIAEEKEIVANFIFLHVRDEDGNIDYEVEFPMIPLEIPIGWHKLFFQMCSDLKPVLEEAGLLDTFYFTQVKEKYNFLRCYFAGWNGVRSVYDILHKYELMSQYICTRCGAPATYTTSNYISSLCGDCWTEELAISVCDTYKEFKLGHDKVTPVQYPDGLKDGLFVNPDNDVCFSDEWNRYMRGNGYVNNQ